MAEKYRYRRDQVFQAAQYKEGCPYLPAGAEMFHDDGDSYPVVSDVNGAMIPLEDGDWVLLNEHGGLIVMSDEKFKEYMEPIPTHQGGERYYPNLTRVGSRP